MLTDVNADIELREYTINNQLDYIVREIYSGHFDVVVFFLCTFGMLKTHS